MHDGHGAAGPTRPELLTEDAGITRRDRGMIETARVDRDFVPTMNRIEAVFWTDQRRDVGTGLKERAKGRSKSVIFRTAPKIRTDTRQTSEQQKRSFFH